MAISIYWIRYRQQPLHELLQGFVALLPQYLPEASSAALFGGIVLGGFSLAWSDVDLVVVVNALEVTPEIEMRAKGLCEALAGRPYGDRIDLLVVPSKRMNSLIRLAGGGLPGLPRTLRIDRRRVTVVEGSPISPFGVVNLSRYGVTLWGHDVRTELPALSENWPMRCLQIFLKDLEGMVQRESGPYGTNPDDAIGTWGVYGLMTEPMWWVRYLYALYTGEMLAKEHAAVWYLGRYPRGSLTRLMGLIATWHERGKALPLELRSVARLFPQAAAEFLGEVLYFIGRPNARATSLSELVELALNALRPYTLDEPLLPKREQTGVTATERAH